MSKEEVIKLLKSKGIELSIDGCGCCQSPIVSIIIDGVKVVDDQSNYNIDMLTEK